MPELFAMALKVCAAVHNPLDAVAKQPLYHLVGPMPIAEATSYLTNWQQLKYSKNRALFNLTVRKLNGKALYSLKNDKSPLQPKVTWE